MNGVRENHSRWRMVLAGTEVLVNPDLACLADPGIGLGWETGIRAQESASRPTNEIEKSSELAGC